MPPATREVVTRRLLAAAVGLGVFAGLGPAAGSAHATSPPVGLSVTLSDGVAEVAPGRDVTYTALLANAGGRPVPVRLVLTVPDYVDVTGARGAKLEAGEASWTVSVPAGRTVSRTATAHVRVIPSGQYRVTTLASVYQGRGAVPLIRTADADRIAGVVDPAHNVQEDSPAARRDAGDRNATSPLLIAVPAIVALAGAVGGLLWWRRRRRALAPG